MEDSDYKLYVLAEIAYKRENKDFDEDIIFPKDWYSMRNYKSKVEIIAEALKHKCLIKDTKLYNERIEGIKTLNKE